MSHTLTEKTHEIFGLAEKKPDFLEKDRNLAVDTFGGRVHVEWDPLLKIMGLPIAKPGRVHICQQALEVR